MKHRRLKVTIGLLIIFMAGCASISQAATYYVRPDGGRCQDITSSGYDSPGDTVFSKECDGLTNAALAGADGTNCACSHPNWVIGNFGGAAALWSAGDTLIIENNLNGSQAEYEIGCPSTAPNDNCMDYRIGINNSGSCWTAYPYGCTLRNIPAGVDSDNTTKIYGEGYASCSSSTTKPQLWGTQRLPYVLQSTDGDIDIQCLEITDHSACIYSGPIDGNVDGFPVQCVRTTSPESGPWAHDGLQMAGVPDNYLVKNVDFHGLGRYGIIIGLDNTTSTFGDITFDNVNVIANAWGGIQTNNQMTSSTSYLVTVKDSTVDWTGCGERYPLQSTLDTVDNVHHCASQTQNASAADGIAFGNGTAGNNSNWWVDNTKVRWNTQDGIDFLHGVAGANIYQKITNSLLEGNAGNALKIVGKQNYVENNLIIGNCGFFYGQSFTATTDSADGSAASFDNCRAGGSPVVYDIGADFKNLWYNNTILSNGTYVFEGAWGSDCNAGTLNQARNNIIYGGTQFNDDSVLFAGSNQLTTLYLAGGSGDCVGEHNVLDEDYNLIYNTKNSNSQCVGANSVCGSDPLFSGTISMGNGSAASYYQSTDYIDQLLLSSLSPAIDEADETIICQGTCSDDYTEASRGASWDIGAIEYGSTLDEEEEDTTPTMGWGCAMSGGVGFE